MRSRIQKQIFLPTAAVAGSATGYGIVPTGTAFYNATTKQYLLKPGQIGFYNADTNTAVDATTIVGVKSIFIAIGVDKTASKLTSDSVRLASGETITSCSIDDASVKAPQEGESNKAKFNFSCTDCSQNYSIGIRINDPTLNFFYPENRYHVELISVQSEECPSCDGDCDYTHDCEEVALKLKAEIEANELLSKYVDTVRTSADPVSPITPAAGFSCAIEITFKVNTAECVCFPPSEAIIDRYTIGSIQVILNSAWAPNSTSVSVDNTGMQLPEGHGAKLQWEEYHEMPGGTGFDGLNSEVETTGAPYYAQLNVSRTKNLLVDCNETYCQYVLGYHTVSPNENANGMYWHPNFITTILVPEAHSTTQTAVEATLNAFVTTGPCGKTIDLECID